METQGHKRTNSHETGESPEAKKVIMSNSPVSDRQLRPIAEGISMPPDDAPTLEWFKASFLKMNEMVDLYNELKDSLDFHSKTVHENKKEIFEMKVSIDKLEKKVVDLEARNNALAAQNLQMQEDTLRNEIRRREFNLIFEGIPDIIKEDTSFLYKKFVDILNSMEVFNGCGSRVQLAKLQRQGPYNRYRKRNVLCQFVRYSDVQLILQNRSQLPHDIFVREDFPEEIERRRSILRPVFNTARRMTKYRGKCRLLVDKLIIDGKTYTAAPIRNLDKLPDDLNLRKLAEKEDDRTLAFFTQSSPFSNFHSASFVIEGKTYLCSEQYIQAEKAKIFEDDVSQSRIMRFVSPYEMKKEGSKVRNFIQQKWESEAEGVAFRACSAKFHQNPELKQILLETQEKELVEASTDPFWGAGMSLSNINILNRNARTGYNALGRVLMRVREMLTSDAAHDDITLVS